MNYQFNSEKNNWLKQERNICFEDIIEAIQGGALLDVRPHPNQRQYPNQEIYVVETHGYVYIVPFVEEEAHIFLKTIYPSRKAAKKYSSRRRNS